MPSSASAPQTDTADQLGVRPLNDREVVGSTSDSVVPSTFKMALALTHCSLETPIRLGLRCLQIMQLFFSKNN